MRRIASIALAALAAAPAIAQGFGDEAAQGERWLSRWDRDGDGFIERQEFYDGLAEDRVFSRYDTDGDGVISEDEFGYAWFSREDTDGDGVIAVREVPPPDPTPVERSGMIGDGMTDSGD